MFKTYIFALLLSVLLVKPLSLPVLCSHSDIGDTDDEVYIINGTEAKDGDNPHMCSIRKHYTKNISQHFCGASIISEEWLITAAHCARRLSMNDYFIRCATLNKDIPGLDYNLTMIIAHNQFRDYANDIALIKIDGEFQFNANIINKIPLPVQNESVPVGAVVKVTGWGQVDDHNYTSPVILRSVDIPVVANDVCNEIIEAKNLNLTVDETMFCAGLAQGGMGSCYGDSGGPVSLNGTLIGIVSGGVGCDRGRGTPGVYTRVALFREWIKEWTRV